MLEKGNYLAMRNHWKGTVHRARQTEEKKGRESVWSFEGERSGLYRCSGCVKTAGRNPQKQREGCIMSKAVGTVLQEVVEYPLIVGGGRWQMDSSMATFSGAPLTVTTNTHSSEISFRFKHFSFL